MEHFKCTLCKQLPLSAVQTACNHFFCGACFLAYADGNKAAVCPNCGKLPKKPKAVPQYEQMLRDAFPKEYEKRDPNKKTRKIDNKERLATLNYTIERLEVSRSRLYARLRSEDMCGQANEFFGTSRQYRVIMCDPPWLYPNQHFNGGICGSYAQMSDEEIFAMPVEGLCLPDAALLLWTTLPKLQVALNAMYAWGFRYTTCFLTWVKVTPRSHEIFTGAGCYTRPNTELCLLGLRGDMSKLRMRNTCVSNVQLSAPTPNPLLADGEQTLGKRLLSHTDEDELQYWLRTSICAPLFTELGEHSEKPEESYEKVIKVFGDVPRFDMFARKLRSGWDSFGDQLDKFPPDKPIDSQLESRWKRRQDQNASFQEGFVQKLQKTWRDRPVSSMDFTPV